MHDRRACKGCERRPACFPPDAHGRRSRANRHANRSRPIWLAAAGTRRWSLGCGMGFARYKNLGAYCAVVMEIVVDHDTGKIAVRRAVAAVDAGQPVNPDGIRNQMEGGIIQSLSWSTLESVTYDAEHRTSFDWSSYPIFRFLD